MRKIFGLRFKQLRGGGISPTESRIEHVVVQRPLQRLLMMRGRSIDDVVNSGIVKNEILAYWKIRNQIHKRMEIVELERQWNPLGL